MSSRRRPGFTACARPAGETPAPSPRGETIVEFREVWKSYSGRDVLAGVNLKIRRGEVLCVLGPSGTGKSVTLRHINGLTQPDAGDVLVFGESDRRPLRRGSSPRCGAGRPCSSRAGRCSTP